MDDCPHRDSHSVFNLINTSSEGGKIISFRRIHFIQGESLELDYSFMEGLKNCFRKLCIEHCSKLLIQSFNYANQWIKKTNKHMLTQIGHKPTYLLTVEFGIRFMSDVFSMTKYAQEQIT